ncbi:MAG: TonB-dependent receptor plug domain-containing protein [Pseudomonadota bacterium]|nr:TonB-dependent receptor plug domain-containing protein [Pseudomonadota bacterium]
MSRFARFCSAAVLAFALLTDGAAAADDQTTLADAQTRIVSGGRLGSGVLPVEDILRSLTQTFGFSFVFDSRVVRGKFITPIDDLKRPATGLEARLKSVDLLLEPISERTYTIRLASAPEPALAAPAPIAISFIDTIVVTSTAASSPGVVEASRIFDLDEIDFSHLNSFEPSEALYAIPQALASFTPANTARYGTSAGLSLADLRGLGPERTLVLVNGRAPTMAPGGNDSVVGVDLNSIAEPFLERIEIDTTPAAARYGPQASVGAVNFKLRSNLNSGQAGLRLGISEHGDAEELSAYVLGGRDLWAGTANITGGVNMTRREGLIGADRDATAVPYGFALNGRASYAPGSVFAPGFGGSSTTDRGAVSGVLLENGDVVSPPGGKSLIPNGAGEPSPYVGTLDQLYNWVAQQNTVLPSDRALAYAAFSINVAPDVRAFIEGFGGLAKTEGRIASLPATRFAGVDSATGDAAVIPIDNPTIPALIRQLILDEYGAAANAILFDHRYAEFGPRRQNVTRRYIDMRAGVEFAEAADEFISLSYRYGLSGSHTREVGRIDRNLLMTALDPAACSAAPGCALADFFDPGGLSAATRDFIMAPPVQRDTSIEEHEIIAFARKRIGTGLPDEGRAYAGVEVKRSALSDRDLTPQSAIVIGSFSTIGVEEALTTADAYAGLDLPLFRSAGLPGAVDMSAVLRETFSSAFDSSLNFEGAMTWEPIEGVKLFTRQHVGHRTPNVVELYNIGQTTEETFVDPCGPGVADGDPVIIVNCASGPPFGVGSDFDVVEVLAAATFYGNPDLKPEKLRTRVFGLAVSPTDLMPEMPGELQIAANWLDYRINNAIVGEYDPLTDCYTSVDLSSTACAINPRSGRPSIVRDQESGRIVAVESLLTNGGLFAWRGLDMELQYALEPDNLGPIDRLWVNGVHSFAERVETVSTSGAVTKLDGLVDFPRHRTLAILGIESGKLEFAAIVHRRGKVLTRRLEEPAARIEPAVYLDASLRYELDDGAYVKLGVENITDKSPPIAAFSDLANTYPQYYDIAGRSYSLSVQMKF